MTSDVEISVASLTVSDPSSGAPNDRDRLPRGASRIIYTENLLLTFEANLKKCDSRPPKPARNAVILASSKGEYALSYRFVNSECRLLRKILNKHGFLEAPEESTSWNLLFSGTHVKPDIFTTLNYYQKINHFPQTTNLTRKDRLIASLKRMRRTHGDDAFGFFPLTFAVPQELKELQSEMAKDTRLLNARRANGDDAVEQPWILKPIGLSRGRGIRLIRDTKSITKDDEPCIVSRYIPNPLLIDGYKFDLRIYVVLTSVDPLRLYVYNDGLVRFATEKYDMNPESFANSFVHLTNYSINKKNENFEFNEDAERSDTGSKWSFQAFVQHLQARGLDADAFVSRMHDLIVKTIISVEQRVRGAHNMYVPYRHNCYELFGFDILVDETLKPWVLEVNLSPAMTCDTPLDLKIKNGLMCDILNMIRMEAYNAESPMPESRLKSFISVADGASGDDGDGGGLNVVAVPRPRAQQTPHQQQQQQSRDKAQAAAAAAAADAELIESALRETEAEYARRGNWTRLYPLPDSDRYDRFFEGPRPLNAAVISRLAKDQPVPEEF